MTVPFGEIAQDGIPDVSGQGDGDQELRETRGPVALVRHFEGSAFSRTPCQRRSSMFWEASRAAVPSGVRR